MLARLIRRPFSYRRDRPLVFAHRGASADAPENTLAAFREAVRQGADGVELDVMACATGQLLVCHDEWLDRLAGEHLAVAATRFTQLRGLDVGRRFGAAFRGERIPTLGEVLQVLPPEMRVNVELKGETVRDAGLAWRVARELRRHEARQEVIVSSFNPLLVARMRAFAPRRATAVLVNASQQLRSRELAARALEVTAIHAEHRICTRENVARWRAAGLAVAAWTVDEPVDVERCCEVGVDAIITNRPAATLALVRRFARGAG